MKPIVFNVESFSEVGLPAIAASFAEMGSDKQAEVLHEMFEALHVACGSDFKFNQQLAFIASSIERFEFNDTKKCIQDISHFFDIDVGQNE